MNLVDNTQNEIKTTIITTHLPIEEQKIEYYTLIKSEIGKPIKIWTEAWEVLETVNLQSVITYDTMGSVDDIVVLSDVKFSEAVVDRIRNAVEK